MCLNSFYSIRVRMSIYLSTSAVLFISESLYDLNFLDNSSWHRVCVSYNSHRCVPLVVHKWMMMMTGEEGNKFHTMVYIQRNKKKRTRDEKEVEKFVENNRMRERV